MKNNLVFVFATFVFMMIGRKIGWGLSKAILYTAPVVLSFVGMVVWGIVVGWCMSGLIGWLHPIVVLRWIMGFALAAYVAIPNYDYFKSHQFPTKRRCVTQ
jgi:hypothetical protein